MVQRITNLLKVVGRNVQVHLGGRDLAMTQQCLDGPKVGVVFQKVGCKAVAQGVRRHGFVDLGPLSPDFSQRDRR